ncbi:MAG: methionyl-tRNA formyltransferase [Candidatus Omnitrophota bacterium]
MKIIFFGSSQFAAVSLKALASCRQEISCVVTQPDRAKGRGLHLESTPVKSTAEQCKLEVLQFKDINSLESATILKEKDADLFVVVSFGQILSGEILSIPKIFSINAHASILPSYRGAAPINWAIIKGEAKTGITIIKMVEKMDAGSIIAKEELAIDAEDTNITLENKLSPLAAGLLVKCIKNIEKKEIKLSEQDLSKVSFAPKLKKEDGLINWGKPAVVISNLVRGTIGWPGAFTYHNGKALKIYKIRIKEGSAGINIHPGEILEVARKGIVVAAAEDQIIIEELQIEGKRVMKAEEFISGHKISVGDRLGKK